MSVCPHRQQGQSSIASNAESQERYDKTKVDIRHKMMLARNISSFEFTCGAHLFPPTEKRKMAMILRPNLSCAMEVEIPYYGAQLGRTDLCSHCGDPESSVNVELKTKFKTVLPICKGISSWFCLQVFLSSYLRHGCQRVRACARG